MIALPSRIAGCAFVLIVFVVGAYADEPIRREQLIERLNEQDKWLGAGTNAQNWRDWLRNDELREMLSGSQTPDPVEAAEILDRYQSGVRGSNHRRFVAVRRALRRWVRQLPTIPVDQLPESINSAEDAIVKITEPDIESAHQQLVTSVEDLDTYLTPGGANGQSWKDYLEWDKLQTQLQAEPMQADLGTLDAINQRFQDYYEGLELDIFADVSKSLTRFIDLRLAAYDEKSEAVFQQRVGELAKAVEAYQADPQGDQFEQLTDLVAYLARRRQAPRLLQQIRLNFAEPNLVAQVSENFVNAGMERDVNQNEPVSDCILGTSISGQGHTTGDVTIKLIPNSEAGVLETVFTGTTQTQTLGVNGPARIRSAGTTQFEATKKLLLDAGGIRTYTAQAEAQTRTRTLGVSSSSRLGGRLIARIASRKVAEQKGVGERIAGRHAAAQISERFNAQVDDELGGENAGLFDRLRAPLARRNALPQQLDISTTDKALQVVWLQGMAGIGAPTAAPKLEGNPDVAVRVHETMINNLAADMLGGHTLTEEDIREMYREMDAELPESLQPIEGKESWSITFARFRPITVRFRDDQLALTVRGREFTSGDSSYPRPMNIDAKYSVVRNDGSLRLQREGEVVVLPPGFRQGQRLNIRDTALRNLLIRRFNKMFKEEFVLDRIALPEQFKQPSSLVSEQFRASEGWLTTDWTLDQTTPVPQDEAVASSVVAGR